MRILISDIVLCLSLVFFALGIFGLYKLPDSYTRMHSIGMSDSFGIGLIIFALLLRSESWILSYKLIITLLLFWTINTTMTHLVAKAAMLYGAKPSENTKKEIV